MADKEVATATIKFDKDKHGGTVRGAVNGRRFEFPVDKDVQVTADQLEALNESHATFTTIKPLDEDADEGSSASSTATGTAIRLGEEDGTLTPVPNEGQPTELSQRTDEELTQEGQKVSQAQAEGGEGTPEAKAAEAPKPEPKPEPKPAPKPAAKKTAAAKAPAAK